MIRAGFKIENPMTKSRTIVVESDFATRAGLAREGKVDDSGRPKNPLQLAITLRTLNKYGGYDARLPMPVQHFLGVSLGWLAEALGYKAVYPQYVNRK